MSLQSDFQSTIWTQIQKAKQNDPKALDDLALKYRPPIVKYIIQRGFPQDHAEDIAQEVFLTIFRDNVLQKADSYKGRFRTLMLSVTNNVIKKLKTKDARQKRGGERLILSMDDPSDDFIQNEIISKEQKTDEDFDRLWMYNLVVLAFQRLKQECDKQDSPYYKVLNMFINEDADYNTIAKELNKSIDNVKFYLHKARSKLTEYIKEEINSYASSKDEYEEELSYLPRFIAKL